MELLPGDIILEHSPTWLGRAIRWATRGKFEPKTKTNHIAGVSKRGNAESGQAMVIEALWTVREHPLSNVDGTIRVYRMYGLNGGERLELADHARYYVGKSYGWWKLGAHLADALIEKTTGRKVFFFRRMLSMDEYPICSWVWAWAYETDLDYGFGTPPSVAAPDDMDDWITGLGSFAWGLVWQRGPL